MFPLCPSREPIHLYPNSHNFPLLVSPRLQETIAELLDSRNGDKRDANPMGSQFGLSPADMTLKLLDSLVMGLEVGIMRAFHARAITG